MKKLLGFLLLFFFFISFAHASPQSQALVAQGRTSLFNTGLPTCSGVLLADGYFQSAVAADSTDQEAQLFYALTRLAVSGLKQGDGPGMETILDFLEAFGISRNSNNNIPEEPIYTDPPKSAGVYLPPETTPNGTQIHQFMDEAFLDLLTAVLENLSHVVDNTIDITLTEVETGDSQVEVDWGDVLLFKSAIKTLKGLILTVNAYSIDGIDTAKLIQLAQADIFQIQRDLIDEYDDPAALSLMGDGADKLTQAKDILISAINDFESAVTFITTESDSQMDDLFSFNEEDINEANMVLEHLKEAKQSVLEDRPAVFQSGDQFWVFTDELDRDFFLIMDVRMGIAIRADVYSYNNAFDIQNGYVRTILFDGSTFKCEIENWTNCGYAPIVLEGNVNGTQITQGTWVQNLCGTVTSGDFTAQKGWDATHVNRQNFNCLFGSNTKAPLDIHVVSPDFNLLNVPIKDTFPGFSVLNGLFPARLTNDDMTDWMHLQPAELISVPEISIEIDGNDDDWEGVDPVFNDLIEESQYLPESTDIEKAYLAKDGQYLYVAMKLANGSPVVPTNQWNRIDYTLNLRTFPDNNLERQVNISAGYDLDAESWSVLLTEFSENSWQEIGNYGSNYVAIGTNFIEFRVPLQVINSSSGYLSGKYITFRTTSYSPMDNNVTLLQIAPAFNIGGSLLVDPGLSGSVIIKLLSDPEGIFVANTYVDGFGSYSLPNIASTDEHHSLVAFQDLDGNGIHTPGEPWDMSEIWGVSNSQSVPLDLYSDLDTDNDGILNSIEDTNQNGVVDAGETDPFNLDSDGDGIQDGTESGLTLNDIGPETDTDIFVPDADPSTQTNPLLKDTDGDGFSDWQEDPNQNGSVDEGEGNPLEKTSVPENIAYRDDFDDLTMHQNWSPLLGQSWAFEQLPNSEQGNLSYNGLYTGAQLPPNSPDFGLLASSKVNTLPDMLSTGIELFTIFISPNNGAEGNPTGVFFGQSLKNGGDPSNSDDYNIHSLQIYEEAGAMYLSVSKNRVQMSSTKLTGMDRNTWFCMGLNIDESNTLHWGVGDWSLQDTVPGVDYIYGGTVPDMTELSGTVGVFTADGGAGFGYFQVIGDGGNASQTSAMPAIYQLLLSN